MIEFVGHVDGAVAGARRARGLLGVLRHALRAFGDLARGRQQLADRGADLGHGRRLLLGAGGLLIGGRLQLGRRASHLADRGSDLLATASCVMNQPMAPTARVPSRPPQRMIAMVMSALARASVGALLQQDPAPPGRPR